MPKQYLPVFLNKKINASTDWTQKRLAHRPRVGYWSPPTPTTGILAVMQNLPNGTVYKWEYAQNQKHFHHREHREHREKTEKNEHRTSNIQ
jgi:hypothetical protein